MSIPDNWDAALSRMAIDIGLVRQHFDSNPFIATAAIADIEIAAGQMSAHYLDLKGESVEGMTAPDARQVLEYMQTCYVAAGINLSYWKGE